MHFLSGALLIAVASAAASYLKLDFDIFEHDTDIIKRSGTAELPMAAKKNYYQATLKMGSMGALNNVIVDTGSSDLWVMANDVTCVPSSRGAGGSTCMADGIYNPGDLSTFLNSTGAPKFNISYGDGTFASGYYGSDSVGFGPVNVSSCEFGVVESTTSLTGIFGIGLPALEAGNTNTDKYNGTGYVYQNFPQALKNAGVIQKNVYSLYLNSPTASSGSVLFGAVDHAKYSGTLQTVPLVNPYVDSFSRPIQFQVVLSSISVQDTKQTYGITQSPVPALLDSGNTLTYLPGSIVDSIAHLMQGSSTGLGIYQVSCDYKTNKDVVNFNFSGQQISVPFADLVLTSNSFCFLGILSIKRDHKSGNPTAILGQNFLRNAYVVYDLEAYEISLAQASYGSKENIEVVTSTIPQAVQASAYSSTSLAEYVSATSQTGSAQTKGSRPTSSTSSSPKSSEGANKMYFAHAVLYSAAGALIVALL